MKVMQTDMDNSLVTKLFEYGILTATFLFNALVLDADVLNLVIAILGSISGAIILAYFRRDARRGEQALKVLCSAIGGFVLGTVLQKYLHIEAPEYKLGLFFTSSMLALIVLRSVLSLTENNVADMLRNVFQRLLGRQLKEERTRRRVEKLEKKLEDVDDSL